MSKMPKNFNRLALLLILIAAVGLRLVAISTRPIWYDEAFAVLFAEKGMQAMLAGTLTQVGGSAADVHPLAYYGLLNAWMSLFSQSLTAIRMLSVLLGVCAILVIYLFSRALAGERMALAAALLMALSPFQIHYAQEIRMYALLVLLLATATLALWLGMRKGGWYWWGLFSISIALAQYTHNLAVFYTLPLALTPIFYKNWRAVRNVVISCLVAVVIVFALAVAIALSVRKSAAELLDDQPRFCTPGDHVNQLYNKPALARRLAAGWLVYRFVSRDIRRMADD